MKKTLYICGDSFCTQDPDFGNNWIDVLIRTCPTVDVVNLAIPGASNYVIFLQVQEALKKKCDYLIYHATSSIRNEFAIGKDQYSQDDLKRYWTPTDQLNKSVLSTSWISVSKHTDLFCQDDHEIKKFFASRLDFLSAINKNYIFIDYTLRAIAESLVPNQWAWSRGGFEHWKFSDHNTHWDFSRWSHRECKINLWDDYDQSGIRPYYHVTNAEIHQSVCDVYMKMLGLSHA